jgi:hypothetical protein
LSAEDFLRAERRLNVLARRISDLELLKVSALEAFSDRDALETRRGQRVVNTDT